MNTRNDSPSIPDSSPVPRAVVDGPSVALLQAENERLQPRIRQLEEERERDRQTQADLQTECDSYRRAAYARALQEITAEDLRRYARNEDGQSLDEVLAELEKLTPAGKDADA